ncbi:MAG TPA: response regulator transcription factor [Gammaproteobacteria bacterium]|nr:response regulator transcription factor [Gammaproteobacteria bacterium]
MKVLIVDDEALACTRLQKLLSEIDGIEVVGEAGNGTEAIKQVHALQPEVVLLDIRMPGMDGLEAGRHLSTLENPPAIIFTTAYGEFALDAFKSHAVDYLLKPISREKLAAGLAAAGKPSRAQLQQIAQENDSARKQICVIDRGDIQMIDIHNIYYFRADSKYLEVRHTNGNALIEESLTTLENEFGELFFRVHRNALVDPNCLAGLSNDKDGTWQLSFQDIDDVIDVSRRQLGKVRAMLKG